MTIELMKDRIEFFLWRLHVCLLCWRHLRHWPWSDISVAEWRESFDTGESPRETFLEGWCRMDDLGDGDE